MSRAVEYLLVQSKRRHGASFDRGSVSAVEMIVVNLLLVGGVLALCWAPVVVALRMAAGLQ